MKYKIPKGAKIFRTTKSNEFKVTGPHWNKITSTVEVIYQIQETWEDVPTLNHTVFKLPERAAPFTYICAHQNDIVRME